MRKIVSFFSICAFSFSLFACSNEISAVDPSSDQVNALAAPKKNSLSSRSMSPELAKQIFESLDINKDGFIDVTEAPVGVSHGSVGKDYVNLENYDYTNSYTEYKGTQPIAVKTAIDSFLQDGGSFSVGNAKISEKNRSKIVSSLANLLVKDSINDGGKVYGFSSNVGYFTGKTKYVICNMDASLLAKKIGQQFEIESGSVNGITKQTAVGSIGVSRDYITIDKYNTRLSFSSDSTFDSGLPFFSSHTLKDPKVIR